MSRRQLLLYALSIACLFLGLFAFRYSHKYWWCWTVASIVCGLLVLRPIKDDDD